MATTKQVPAEKTLQTHGKPIRHNIVKPTSKFDLIDIVRD